MDAGRRSGWIYLLRYCLVMLLLLSVFEADERPVAQASSTPTRPVQAIAPAASTQVTAPKWLAAPAMTGQCSDPSFAQAGAGTVALANSNGPSNATVLVLH